MIRAGRDDTGSIRRECGMVYVTRVPLQHQQRLAAGAIPNPCRLIGAGSNDAQSIRSERSIPNSVGMFSQGSEQFTTWPFPDLGSGIIGAGSNNLPTVGREVCKCAG